MILYRQKIFGVGGQVVKYLKTPQGMIATTALGVSTASLATNLHRNRKDRTYQKNQLNAMNNLTRTLGRVNGTMEKSIEQQKEIMDNTPAVQVPQSQQSSGMFGFFKRRP